MIAFTFLGLTSIPHLETMNPRSLPDLTLKTHFFGLSRNLYLARRSKTNSRIAGCSSLVFFLLGWHLHNPPILCAWGHRILFSWHVDMWCQHFWNEKAWTDNRMFPMVWWRYFYVDLLLLCLSSYTLRMHPRGIAFHVPLLDRQGCWCWEVENHLWDMLYLGPKSLYILWWIYPIWNWDLC